MNTVVYGIKNCDTMKKAFAWLESNSVAYRFHDYRKEGIDTATLLRWCHILGWENLVNKRGTTWRKLSAEQQTVTGEAEAIALMQSQTSLIRRPIIEFPGPDDEPQLLVGFDAGQYAQSLQREEKS